MAERWIEFAPGREISDLGRYRRGGKLFTPKARSSGYPCINVGGRVRRIHEIVLEAFVGTRPPGAVCRHLDDNKENNALTNLTWGSQSENAVDCVTNGHNHESSRLLCEKGHPLDGVSRTRGRRDFRFCRTCHNEVMRARRANRSCNRCGGPREGVGHRKNGDTYNYCLQCVGRRATQKAAADG